MSRRNQTSPHRKTTDELLENLADNLPPVDYQVKCCAICDRVIEHGTGKIRMYGEQIVHFCKRCWS